eukprot:g6837.t1
MSSTRSTSAAASPDALNGYLLKRGQLVKSWKRRWFEIDAERSTMSYFSDDPAKGGVQKGALDLADAMAIVARETRVQAGHPNYFVVVAGKRRLHLSAATEVDMRRWVAAVGAVSVAETFVMDSTGDTAMDRLGAGANAAMEQIRVMAEELNRHIEIYEVTLSTKIVLPEGGSGLGLLLQRANDAVIVNENQREDVTVSAGSMLFSVNRAPTSGMSYGDAVGAIAAAAWPIQLGFVRAPTRRGALLKRRAGKPWAKRWFDVREGRVDYYENDCGGALLGRFPLQGAAVSVADLGGKRPFGFIVFKNSREQLIVSAGSAEERFSWCAFLDHAITHASGGTYLQNNDEKSIRKRMSLFRGGAPAGGGPGSGGSGMLARRSQLEKEIFGGGGGRRGTSSLRKQSGGGAGGGATASAGDRGSSGSSGTGKTAPAAAGARRSVTGMRVGSGKTALALGQANTRRSVLLSASARKRLSSLHLANQTALQEQLRDALVAAERQSTSALGDGDGAGVGSNGAAGADAAQGTSEGAAVVAAAAGGAKQDDSRTDAGEEEEEQQQEEEEEAAAVKSVVDELAKQQAEDPFLSGALRTNIAKHVVEITDTAVADAAIGNLCCDETIVNAFGEAGLEAVLCPMLNTDYSELSFSGMRALKQLLVHSAARKAAIERDMAGSLAQLTEDYPSYDQLKLMGDGNQSCAGGGVEARWGGGGRG